MRSQNRYAGIDSYALSFIRQQINKMIGHPYFSRDDYEDLEQELVLDFILRWPDFDASKGSKISFIQMVVTRRCSNIIKEIETMKRGQGEKPSSLNQLLYNDTDGDAIELIEAISSDEGLWGNAYFGWDQLSADLRSDLQKAISTLPEDLQVICEKLKTMTVTDVAKDIGIPRSNVNNAIVKLREIMGKAGLKIYL